MSPPVAKDTSLAEARRVAEEASIQDALIQTEGNLRAAARILGIGPATLKRRMPAGSRLRLWLGQVFPSRHGQRIDAAGQIVIGRRKRAANGAEEK